MTKEERRFFRHISRNLRTGEEVQELQLFDALESADAYDEDALKLRFKEIWNSNQFAVAKNQLYNNLLHSLVFGSQDRGYRRRVRMLIQQVEILYHRELYDQCKKLLDKAAKLADQSDHPQLQLEVTEWKVRLWTVQYFRDVPVEQFQQANQQISTLTDKLMRLSQYEEQINEMVYQYRTSSVFQSRAQFVQMHERRINTILFTEPSLADSNPASILFHYGHGFYHFLAGNPVKSFEHYNEIMLKLEAMPENVYDYFNFYLPIIYGHALLALNSRNYDAAAQSIQKIEQLQVEHPSQKTRNAYFSHILKIEYYFATNQPDQLKSHLETAEKRIPLLEKHLSTQEMLIFLINTGVGTYVVGDVKRALKWLVRVMQTPHLSSFQDYHFIAMVMQILFNYELRNDDVLPSLLRSLQRWMEKRERPYRMEHLLVEFITKVTAAASQKDALDLCIHYRSQFIALDVNPEERPTSKYFDFVSWLDAQIEGVKYGDVVRRKAVLID